MKKTAEMLRMERDMNGNPELREKPEAAFRHVFGSNLRFPCTIPKIRF